MLATEPVALVSPFQNCSAFSVARQHLSELAAFRKLEFQHLPALNNHNSRFSASELDSEPSQESGRDIKVSSALAEFDFAIEDPAAFEEALDST